MYFVHSVQANKLPRIIHTPLTSKKEIQKTRENGQSFDNLLVLVPNWLVYLNNMGAFPLFVHLASDEFSYGGCSLLALVLGLANYANETRKWAVLIARCAGLGKLEPGALAGLIVTMRRFALLFAIIIELPDHGNRLSIRATR